MADTGTQTGAPAAAQQQSAPAAVDVGQLANSLLDALDSRKSDQYPSVGMTGAAGVFTYAKKRAIPAKL